MWFLRLGNDVFGPLSERELRELARRGGVVAGTDVSRDGTLWFKASEIPSMEFGATSELALQTAGQPEPSVRKEISAGWIIGGTMCGGFLLLVLAFLVLVWIGSTTEASRPNDLLQVDPVHPDFVVAGNPANTLPKAAPVSPRLNVRWQEATPELVSLLQGLSTEQRTVLGIAALATGVDVYAARVELTNEGNVPLRISPQRILVHFGQESARVSTLNAPQFLREGILQPGQSTSGLVTFIARIDIGAAIRFGEGALSYEDPSIEISYR